MCVCVCVCVCVCCKVNLNQTVTTTLCGTLRNAHLNHIILQMVVFVLLQSHCQCTLIYLAQTAKWNIRCQN